MKILLVAINAKYIHSNLAVISLAEYAREKMMRENAGTDGEIPDAAEVIIETAAYTINQPQEQILADIYGRKPDILMFSCYIWNRRQVEELAADAGKVMEKVDIWLGGPEVSFDAEDTLKKLHSVKGVMVGEGEETFYRLARSYAEVFRKSALFPEEGIRQVILPFDEIGIPEADRSLPDRELEKIGGIVFRRADGSISSGGPAEQVDFSQAPFPYEDSGEFENKIIYYESSRGCPFRCAYCLSSVDKTMRYRDTEKVKEELGIFLAKGVPQVKFIDRTFNCDGQRAANIWRFLRERDNGVTNFHFEIAGDILTEEELMLLKEMRPGQVQLEIGVQSTNEETLREINRPVDLTRLRSNVASVREGGNVHIHLDLIAGLPMEGYESFGTSFDDVFSMRPHQLQLGFLKVLKGTPMETRQERYGIRHREGPPYEVLETRWISYDELIRLKRVEEMVEVYFNSGQFGGALETLMKCFDGPFSFFERLAGWYDSRQDVMVNMSRNQRYQRLMEFACEMVTRQDMNRFIEAIVFDYYMRENIKTRPVFFGEETVEKSFSKEFYSREAREHRYLAGGRYDTDDPRLLRKLTHLEKAGGKYYLFDYENRNPIDGNARVIEVK